MEQMQTGLRYRIKRAARQIGEQHRQLGELVRALRAALESSLVADVRSAFERYRAAVMAHFALEEDVFFPAVHGLHPEHEGDLEGLSEVSIAADSLEQFERRFRDFAERLAAHESREEALVSHLAD
jgi:hypothetical protein